MTLWPRMGEQFFAYCVLMDAQSGVGMSRKKARRMAIRAGLTGKQINYALHKPQRFGGLRTIRCAPALRPSIAQF